MNEFIIAGAALAAMAVLLCLASVVAGARSQVLFDEHVQDDLDLIAADNRSTGLTANAAWNGWY